MKKKLIAAMLMLMLAGAVAACGSKDAGEEAEGVVNDTEESGNETADEDEEAADVEETVDGSEDDETSDLKYLSDFRAGDYVTLGEYKGLVVELEEPEMSDEYLEGLLNVTMTDYVDSKEVTDRSVKLGDTVNIDYEGKMDGVAFDGGTAKGVDLTIGSNSYIDGFEDGIIGMEIGETKDLDLNFPDPYTNNPDLSGAAVVFTVTVNSISVPDITDEYVEELGREECSTAEEFKNYMFEALREQLKENFETEKMNAAVEAAEANAVFESVPTGMLNRINETLTNNISVYASIYGLDISDYVAYVYGDSENDYQSVLLEQAKITAQRYILMAAIADEEGIEITDEELEESISEMTSGYASYGYESEEAYRETIDEEAYREYLLIQEVGDFLGENAILNSTSGE